MDMSIKFYENVTYYPFLMHTVIDDNIISYKVSEESYIAWEYLKTKARTCKIKCYGSDWIYNNLMTYANVLKDDEDNDRAYASYVVKLQLGDDYIFSGWIKNNTLKRTFQQDASGNDISIIEFTIYDLLDVIKEGFDYDKIYEDVSTINYVIDDVLNRIVRDAIKKTNSTVDTDSKTNEYFNFDNSNPTELTLTDFEIAQLYWNGLIPYFYNFVDYSTWSSPRQIIKFIRDSENGKLYLMLWTGYVGELTPGDHNISINGYTYATDVGTHAAQRKLTIYNISGTSVTKVYDERYPVSTVLTEGIMAWPGEWTIEWSGYESIITYTHGDIETFYHQDIAEISPLLLDDGETLTIPDTVTNESEWTWNHPYYYLRYYSNAPFDEVKVNGTFTVNRAKFKPTDEEEDVAILKASDVLKNILILRDLTMYCDENGILQIHNKRRSSAPTLINEDDLISYTQSQLEFSLDDILSLFSVININLSIMDEFLEDLLVLYYKDLLGTNILELEILNNGYGLKLGDTIRIRGISYTIYSISKIPTAGDTNEYFSYKVKAWEII